MPPQVALLVCVAFILWLFARDQRLRPMTSWALWIPLLWLVIITSKPVSLWFGGGLYIEKPDDYLDGSPVDRNVFLLLIVSGLLVLAKRGLDWGKVSNANSGHASPG